MKPTLQQIIRSMCREGTNFASKLCTVAVASPTFRTFVPTAASTLLISNAKRFFTLPAVCCPRTFPYFATSTYDKQIVQLIPFAVICAKYQLICSLYRIPVNDYAYAVLNFMKDYCSRRNDIRLYFDITFGFTVLLFLKEI